MSRTRAALFVSGTLEVGGSETKVVRIANALAEAGRPVGLAYLNPPDTLLSRVRPGLPVFHLARRGKYSPASLRQLRRLVGSGYDVLLAVNFYPLLYVLPGLAGHRRRGARSIALINTTTFVDGQWIHGHFYAPFLRRCDHLVYGCRMQQGLWSEKYRLPEERATCIYNGVDTERYATPDAVARRAARAAFGIPESAFVVGGVGRLAPEKDFGLLVQAVAGLRASGRDAWLLVVGEGAERAALERLVAASGLGAAAVLPGILDDVRPALTAMDAFVLPSRAVETFSNAALEAMAMQRPVVLTRVGGAPEMVEDGISGFLFEPGDRATLTALLSRLHDDAALCERTGAAARERVLREFRFGAMVERYEALIWPRGAA